MAPILVTSTISIASVPVYFRVLGDEMYAIWFYVGTLTGAFGFMDLGVGVAVGRFIGVAIGSGERAAVREYWSTGHVVVLPFIMLFSVVFILLGTIWGPSWFKVEDQSSIATLRWAMFFGGVALFFNYYGQMWTILAQTHLDFRYLSLLRTWFSLASTGGSLGLALLYPSVAAILLFTALLAAGQFLILFLRGSRRYDLPVRFSLFRLNRLKEMLPYTLKTFGQLLSGSLLGSLDRLFLGRVAPALDFAAFNVSLNIGSRLSGLSVAAMGPVFHNTTRGIGGDKERSPAAVYRESFHFMFPWYSLVFIGTFFWAKPVVNVWLGKPYGPVVGDCFPWVVGALCVQAVVNISGAQLGGLNRVGTGLILQTISAIASTVGVVVGWMWGGLLGAAIGFFAARLVWVVQDALVRRWVGVSFAEYRELLWVIIRQCVFVGAIWCVAHGSTSSPWLLLSSATITAVVGAAIEVALTRRPYQTF